MLIALSRKLRIWNIGRHCHKHLTTPPFLEIIKAAVKCSRDVMNLHSHNDDKVNSFGSSTDRSLDRDVGLNSA